MPGHASLDPVAASLAANLNAARRARNSHNPQAAYSPALMLGAIARHGTRRSEVIRAGAELRRLAACFGDALPAIAREA
jgi:hypothetical protein